MEPSVLAKGAAGQYFTDLVKASEDHLKRIYPECVNSTHHETVMCPPVFPFGYVSPTGQASGATELTKIEEDAIRGDIAELEIFQRLEEFGEKTKQPMFVLTKLEISQFTKNVLRQRLPADHSVLSQNLKGEIDFMIINRRIGVILMEVKSKAEFRKNIQSKARKELQNAEVFIGIIHALLHPKPKPEPDSNAKIGIPVYKVIAMPNVDDLCRDNPNFVGLRKINVRSFDDFSTWWGMKFTEREFNTKEKQELQNLISIFVGQMCEVSAAVLSNVYKKIDTQAFLEKSYEKEVEDTGDGSQLVMKPAERSEQAILATQFLFLNPDQLRIWNGDSHMFFNGSSGSGKTILLQFRALKCAKNSQKVVVVVPSTLIARYNEFFAQNGISGEMVDVLSPVDFFRGNYAKSDGTSQFHFFADELQTFQTEIPDILTPLAKLMARFVDSDCYCWVAYDYMQRNEDFVSQDETGGFVSGAKLQDQARRLCDTYNFYHSPCLKTVVRSTFQIYNYVQGFVKKSLEDLLKGLMLLEHIDKETKQKWTQFVERYDVSNHIGHRICGPSVSVFRDLDLDAICQMIQTEVSKWASEDFLDRVAVLVATTFPKERLSQLMTTKMIPVCEVGSQTNAVVIDFGHRAHSYEWPVVVAISSSKVHRFSDNYIMFTRAITRLVVITSRCN